MTLIVDFFRNDPLVAWFLTAGFLVLLAGAVFAVWKAHVEEQAARQADRDRELRRCLDAASQCPPMHGHKTPWRDRRKAS